MTDEFKKLMEFYEEARKDLTPNKEKDFICPICGGKAHSEMHGNGHVWANCEKCGKRFMQ